MAQRRLIREREARVLIQRERVRGEGEVLRGETQGKEGPFEALKCECRGTCGVVRRVRGDHVQMESHTLRVRVLARGGGRWRQEHMRLQERDGGAQTGQPGLEPRGRQVGVAYSSGHPAHDLSTRPAVSTRPTRT